MKVEPLDCNRIENSLALFVGGELASAARQQVQQHLETCGACRASEQRLVAARTALRSGLGRHGNVPDLWPGVRAALLEERRLGPTQPIVQLESARTVVRPQPARRWIPWSAAAAVLFALGLWIGQASHTTPPPSVPSLVDGDSVVTPVRGPRAQPVGLRRVGADEAPLAEQAQPYTLEFEDLLAPSRQSSGAAVSPVSGWHGLH